MCQRIAAPADNLRKYCVCIRLEGSIPQVLAIEFKNIEGAEYRGAAVAVIPDESDRPLSSYDGLSIDHA